MYRSFSKLSAWFFGISVERRPARVGREAQVIPFVTCVENLKQKWISFIVIKVSFLTYSDRSFTNGVNKSPSNFLILLLLSHLRNKCILRNWSTHYWFNKWLHPNQKNTAALTLFRQLISLTTDDNRCEYNFTHIRRLTKLCVSGVWTQIETNTFLKYQTWTYALIYL